MIGFGTLLNTLAIVSGGVMGLLFGRLLKPGIQDALTKVCGVSTVCIALSGVLSKMGVIQNSALIVICTLALGTLAGELMNLEGLLERFGRWLKVKTRSTGDGGFVNAFVTASLTVCIGAMAIVGSIQDGILGDYNTLLMKAILDFVIICVMTASMGKGCAFSAIPVALFQGSITLLARGIEPIMTEPALNNLSLVGSMLIFCVGVNLVWEKKFKVANMLPAIVVAVIWAFF